MTVFFANSGPLDLTMITVMGISVKKTTSPIGFFGTGLKFALATLLRTGHSVRLWTEGSWHIFTLTEREVRGEKFQIVCMDGEALPFTSQLGRNWVPWQAYRELASNARDEPDCLVSSGGVDPEAHDTCWVVTGEGIEQAHRERTDIFCESRVLHRLEGVAEVREGGSDWIYYRGVRVGKLQHPSLWTWNLLSQVELTEDRTLKYMFQTHAPMAQLVAQSDDVEFITSVLCAHDACLEHRADFSYVTGPSETYMRTARGCAQRSSINHTARRLWQREAPTEDAYDDAILDEGDLDVVREAEELCLRVDPDYAASPRFVVSLEDGCYGMVRGEDILISHTAVTMGVDFLAATMYEEYLHLQHGFSDESRQMQNHLFQQCVRLARRLGG